MAVQHNHPRTTPDARHGTAQDRRRPLPWTHPTTRSNCHPTSSAIGISHSTSPTMVMRLCTQSKGPPAGGHNQRTKTRSVTVSACKRPTPSSPTEHIHQTPKCPTTIDKFADLGSLVSVWVRAAMSAAVRCHVPAVAFAWIWLAPAITLATAGWAARPAIARRAANGRVRRRKQSALRSCPSRRRRASFGSGLAKDGCPRPAAGHADTCPVSRPESSGKNGSKPSPNCSQAGTTSVSTARCCRLY